MRRLIPDTIATRTLLVLIVGLTLSHVLSVALYFTDRTSALLFTGGEHIGERIATVLRLVEFAKPEERQRIVELADYPKLHVFWSPASAIGEHQDEDWQTDVLREALIAHLGNAPLQTLRVHHAEDIDVEPWRRHLRRDQPDTKLGEVLMASLQMPDGSWLNFAAQVQSPQPFWSFRFALSMAVMLLAVIVLSAVVVHYLTRPLRTFARAAQRLGTDVRAPPIPMWGPAEVRQAIGAFNEMQERIRHFVEDRTQMLAAITHDLGTPITRLRLRAEFVEDEEQRRKMLADLDDMEKMVFSALSFARDEAASEARVMIDLKTLLRRVCDDAEDAGHDVTLNVENEAVAYRCQPAALRRALSNLIDNAIKYGGRARVSLEDQGDEIRIRIDDDGPGIPDELQGDAFKPFRRLEVSRSRETGGTGLGLTVARTIARAHGGDITLTNRSEGGLRAEVILPR